MTLEEAIKTALEYENNIRDVYRDAVEKTTDETGKRMLEILAEDEQRHVDFLNARLDQWKKTGKITMEKLDTTIPPMRSIKESVSKLEKRMSDKDFGVERELLKKVVDVEYETSEFYKSVVGDLDDEGQKMFQRFVEIEEGHLAIVKAELDYLTGSGYWFDFSEISMEH
jgi:rubrerythrin